MSGVANPARRMTALQVAPIERSEPGGNVFGMAGIGIASEGDMILVSITDQDGLSLTARLDGEGIDRLLHRFARALESETDRELAAAPEISDIDKALCRIVLNAARMTGAGVRNIAGPNREPRIVRTRDAVVWVAKRVTKASWPDIGRALAHDHTSMIAAEKRAIALLKTDGEYGRFCLGLLEAARADIGRLQPLPDDAA